MPMTLCESCSRELWRIHPLIIAMDIAVLDGFASNDDEKAKFLVGMWDRLRLELNCMFTSSGDGTDEQE